MSTLSTSESLPPPPAPSGECKTSFFWRYTIGSLKVEFDNVPFSVGEKRILDCQHGSEYYKQRKPMGKRTRLQSTRKIGCNAHIVCRQYILYPHYGIPEKESLNKTKERERKQENLKRLRRVEYR